MAKDRTTGSAAEPATVNNQNIYVEPGETVVLAPDSQRFTGLYKRFYPSSIDEARSVLGLSDAASEALSAKATCRDACLPPVLASPEQLVSEDKEVRRRAKAVAISAARAFVTSTRPESLAQWKPLVDRYLELHKIAINSVSLGDLEIANGGTLIISANTNRVNANNIKIHGSGRIVCKGDVSINCTTLQGLSGSAKQAPLSAQLFGR